MSRLSAAGWRRRAPAVIAPGNADMRWRRAARFAILILLACALAGTERTATPAMAENAPSTGSASFNSLKGKFLVAAPDMPSKAFRKSVILMVEHNREGAYGLIVNKPASEVSKGKFYEELKLAPQEAEGTFILFYGGPVELHAGFVVHDGGAAFERSQSLGEGLAVSGAIPILTALAEGRGPKRYLVVLGYAGWAAGQLESELARNDWVTAPLDLDIVFDRNFDTKWKRAFEARYRTL